MDNKSNKILVGRDDTILEKLKQPWNTVLPCNTVDTAMVRREPIFYERFQRNVLP